MWHLRLIGRLITAPMLSGHYPVGTKRIVEDCGEVFLNDFLLPAGGMGHAEPIDVTLVEIRTN